MEEMNYISTNEGTPQGGIISPMLCNVALNGIEEEINKANPKKRGVSAGVHIIRYADDIVITAKSKEIAEKNKEILVSFLATRGLELSEKKTRIIHIKEGFDYLGFNISRKRFISKYNSPTDQETVLIIKPSKKGVDKLKNTVRSIIKRNKPMIAILTLINPVLRG